MYLFTFFPVFGEKMEPNVCMFGAGQKTISLGKHKALKEQLQSSA